MRSTFSRGTALALLPALGMLVLAGCGDDSGSGATPSTSPSTAPSSEPTATPTGIPSSTGTPGSTPNTKSPSNTADPSGEQADVTVNVTVANGKVNPSGASIKVKAGQTVLITGVSDAEDELHVHGYDKELELKPGKPASVKFTANMKGTFEVETHESGKLVAKLVVS
ncbi:cupredoxin domain-containing protein [Kribbella sp. NPDC023855]|uniref:cupredoxin domain-containing protein n=1 Tax=Kribbella sp. NPDC023855 TaxID=3154698 RepID=UPI0033FFA1FA